MVFSSRHYAVSKNFIHLNDNSTWAKLHRKRNSRSTEKGKDEANHHKCQRLLQIKHCVSNFAWRRRKYDLPFITSKYSWIYWISSLRCIINPTIVFDRESNVDEEVYWHFDAGARDIITSYYWRDDVYWIAILQRLPRMMQLDALVHCIMFHCNRKQSSLMFVDRLSTDLMHGRFLQTSSCYVSSVIQHITLHNSACKLCNTAHCITWQCANKLQLFEYKNRHHIGSTCFF